MELKVPNQITKDDNDDALQTNKQNSQYKNYIPLCISIVVVGLGLYVYKSKQVAPVVQNPAPMIRQKQIDPFEFN